MMYRFLKSNCKSRDECLNKDSVACGRCTRNRSQIKDRFVRDKKPRLKVNMESERR